MKLHHIGKVVADLDQAIKYHKDTFGFEPLGPVEIDPIQKVEVVLLNTGFGEDVTLELIKPTGGDSPIDKFLKKGGGLHHLSYEVPDIQKAIDQCRANGALILGEIVPSKAHKAPSIWLYTQSKELIELIEKR